MTQWDNYLAQEPYALHHPLFHTALPMFFKQCDEDSYTRFRKLMQYLDCALLEIQTVEYDQHLLVCAFMYLIVGVDLEFFTMAEALHEFPCSSHYLLRDDCFNDLFSHFLASTFNCLLQELLPTVQYCATYLGLKIMNSQPILPNQEEATETMELEEYCSFQTFNKHIYAAVKKRKRGLFA